MDNIELFELSLKHKEPIFDPDKRKEEIVLNDDPRIKSEIVANNERLISLIDAYRTMLAKLTPKQKMDILREIDNILFKRDKMNYTALSQYLFTLNLSNSLLKSKSPHERMPILQAVLELYISNRHGKYLAHGYSNMILQVISDNYSHKRSGSTGTAVIEQILQSYGIKRYVKGVDIDKESYYMLPDRGDRKNFESILKRNKIKLAWSLAKQGKYPDAYIQTKRNRLIIEHKHKKESGGGQSSQNVEIVDFIKNQEKGISYVTFMDGPFFNVLAEDSAQDKKTKTLLGDIIRCLNENKNNYFVNTKGFSELIKRIV